MVTLTNAPDSAAQHPGYGIYTALRMMNRKDQTLKNIVPNIDYIFSGDVQEFFMTQRGQARMTQSIKVPGSN